MQKTLLIAVFAITAAVLIGSSFSMAALAIKHKDTTLNNVVRIVATDAKGTTNINVFSVPGKNGLNGTNGKDGVNGKDGINGTNGKDGRDGTNGTNGVDGRNGINGTNGKDGTITFECLGANNTIVPCPSPEPTPVTNGTGNATSLKK